MMTLSKPTWSIALVAMFCPIAISNAADVQFNRDIRPILSQTCFHCHGPDEHGRAAGLRLDSIEGATEDLGGYQPIVPGDLNASEAWTRIVSDDPDTLMPPPDSHVSLTPLRCNHWFPKTPPVGLAGPSMRLCCGESNRRAGNRRPKPTRGRFCVQHRRRPRPHSRPERDGAASVGHRSQAVYIPIPWPRPTLDRRRRSSRYQKHPGMIL